MYLYAESAPFKRICWRMWEGERAKTPVNAISLATSASQQSMDNYSAAK